MDATLSNTIEQYLSLSDDDKKILRDMIQKIEAEKERENFLKEVEDAELEIASGIQQKDIKQTIDELNKL